MSKPKWSNPLNTSVASSSDPPKDNSWFYPWWEIDHEEQMVKSYLASEREELTLLLDTGSPDNLCGDAFVERIQRQAAEHLRDPPHFQAMTRPLRVGGVGTGSQTATSNATMPIGVQSQQEGAQDGVYSAPILPQSKCPALLGRRSMRENRMLLDTYRGRAYCVGPGGYQLRLSVGSRVFETIDSLAGHMLLPCSRFPAQRTRPEDALSFAVQPEKEEEPIDKIAKKEQTGGVRPRSASPSA